MTENSSFRRTRDFVASEDSFEEAMRRAQDGNGSSDFKMTPEEVDKFSRAFKDPAFRKMMADYVQDISDPAHRAEQNAYISELERKGEIPNGKDLIRPKAGFVVKTRRAKDSSKLFVNVVESDRVDKPTSQRGTQSQQGTQWMLPHILGPPRLERDKKGETATTFDCCFHPSAVARAKVQKPFRDMMSQTAFETIEKAYAKMGSSDEKLLREYHVLLGTVYKTGEPLPLVVGAEKEENKEEDSTTPAEKKKKTRRAGKKKKKTDDLQQQKTSSSTADEEDEIEDKGLAAAMKGKLSSPPPPQKQIAPRGGTIPAYTVTERGYFDLADHVESVANRPKRPKELVVAIELPEMKSAKRVDLECSSREIVLTAKNAEDEVVYSLDAGLPLEVDGDAGAAKYDSKARILTIVLPVIPPSTKQEQNSHLNERVEATASDAKIDDVAAEAPPEKVPERVVMPPEKAHSRWLEKSKESGTRKSFAKDSIAPREESRAPEKPPAQSSNETTDDFIARGAFDGPMAGFAFRSGSRGLGYYRDLIQVEHRQNPESVTLIIGLEGVEKVDMAFDKNAVQITCTFFSDRPKSTFKASFAGEIDRERCRADASDKNVAVIIRKQQTGIWKEPVAFDDRAIDVTKPPTPRKNGRKKSSRGQKPSTTPSPAPNNKTEDDKIPIAPTKFQNTLLFEIE